MPLFLLGIPLAKALMIAGAGAVGGWWLGQEIARERQEEEHRADIGVGIDWTIIILVIICIIGAIIFFKFFWKK